MNEFYLFHFFILRMFVLIGRFFLGPNKNEKILSFDAAGGEPCFLRLLCSLVSAFTAFYHGGGLLRRRQNRRGVPRLFIEKPIWFYP